MVSHTSNEHECFIALGSNLDDRIANLNLGLRALNHRAGTVTRTSLLYKTRPQYVQDQPAFLNATCALRTKLSAAKLLTVLKQIERDIGRVPSIRYGPRKIDLDILFYDSSVIHIEKTQEGPLCVPHALLQERAFVLRPLCDIAKDFVHPVLQKTVQELYTQYGLDNPSCPDGGIIQAFPLYTVDEEIFSAQQTCYVMGILNVTPDSFSDGGKYEALDEAVNYVLEEMIPSGVDIIDIGGESTRPGASAVSEEEELKRVIPVIQEIRKHSKIAISIDTTKASVAKAAIQAGANMINDVSGGERDSAMLSTAAELQVPIVLMHSRGTPSTMSQLKQYSEKHGGEKSGYGPVFDDVVATLKRRVEAAEAIGVSRWNIVVDPGIGFAKGMNENLDLLRGLEPFVAHMDNVPCLLGTSRKKFLGTIIDPSNVQNRQKSKQDRDAATAATTSMAAAARFTFVRVHNVRMNKDVCRVVNAVSAQKNK